MLKKKIFILILLIVSSYSCTNPEVEKSNFDFFAEQFEDIKVLRYQVPGFEELTLKQKKLVYFLTEAGLAGRDIMYDQNYRHNLSIRRALENIYTKYKGDKDNKNWKNFEIYLKRIWFSNGIHHHYSNDKFIPGFSDEYLQSLLSDTETSLNSDALNIIFDDKDSKKVNSE